MQKCIGILTLIAIVALTAWSQTKQIAFTFDDLPISGPSGDAQSLTAEITAVNTKLLAAIKRERIPAIGFVNESRLYARGQTDARIDALRMWIDAGLELGNHTFSHISIDQNPIERYEEDVIRGETVTRMLLAEKKLPLRYFRHTQLRTGPTEDYRKKLAAFLESRGYTVAPVTIDNQEWIFASIYARAKSKGDSATMKKVGDEYVAYMERVFVFFENLSKETFKREIPQTLLLHVNSLNADYFDRLVGMIKKRGYVFVPLGTALQDAVYSRPEVQANKGLSWIHRWRLADGLALEEEPAEPGWIGELNRSYR